MAIKQRISNAEWQIMNIIWDKSPITAKDIIQSCASNTDWNPKTVKSLINRLTLKKKIDYSQQGRKYVYQPLVSKSDCINEEQSLILNKTFNNSPKEMIISILKNYPLTTTDLEEIRSILESNTSTIKEEAELQKKGFDVCLL